MNYALLIPAYNAERSLGSLLERAVRIVSSDRIVVVDDGSNDRTSTIAAGFTVEVIRHPYNKGKGAALQTGFDHCLDRSFDAVITLDADLQHKPEDIPRFSALYDVAHYDIIIGSRLHDMSTMPLHRMASNAITTFLVGVRTGIRISDSQSGFRCISRRVLETIRMESAGFEAETEFLIKAAAKRFSFGSVPIETIYAGEKSHMTHIATTMNFIKVLLKQYS